jgi:hypothetical protein
MKVFISFKKRLFALFTSLFLFPCLFTACDKKQNIAEYFSEYRSNLFIAETDDFSLRAYAIEKEHPFVADGMVGVKATFTEVYISASDGSLPCKVSFRVSNLDYSGEAAYDSVKREYFFSCAADVCDTQILPVSIELGGSMYEVNALSVKTDDTLDGEIAVGFLQQSEQEFFKSITIKGRLEAELHVRLIYEEAPYYYVGIVEKSGKRTAFLLDAETGKLLAKRES